MDIDFSYLVRCIDDPYSHRRRIHRSVQIKEDGSHWKTKIYHTPPPYPGFSENPGGLEYPLYLARLSKHPIGHLHITADGSSVAPYSRIQCSRFVALYLKKLIVKSCEKFTSRDYLASVRTSRELLRAYIRGARMSAASQDHLLERLDSAYDLVSRMSDPSSISPVTAIIDPAIVSSPIDDSIEGMLTTLALVDPFDSADRYRRIAGWPFFESSDINGETLRAFLQVQLDYDLWPYFSATHLTSFLFGQLDTLCLLTEISNRVANEVYNVFQQSDQEPFNGSSFGLSHNPVANFLACSRELYLLKRNSEEAGKKAPSEEDLANYWESLVTFSMISSLFHLTLTGLSDSNKSHAAVVIDEILTWAMRGYAVIVPHRIEPGSPDSSDIIEIELEWWATHEGTTEEEDVGRTFRVPTPLGQAQVYHTEIEIDDSEAVIVDEVFERLEKGKYHQTRYPVMGRFAHGKRYLHISSTRPGIPSERDPDQYEVDFFLSVRVLPIPALWMQLRSFLHGVSFITIASIVLSAISLILLRMPSSAESQKSLQDNGFFIPLAITVLGTVVTLALGSEKQRYTPKSRYIRESYRGATWNLVFDMVLLSFATYFLPLSLFASFDSSTQEFTSLLLPGVVGAMTIFVTLLTIVALTNTMKEIGFAGHILDKSQNVELPSLESWPIAIAMEEVRPPLTKNPIVRLYRWLTGVR